MAQMTKDSNIRTELFGSTPIPKAVMNLAVPSDLSSLVMVIYNLADTYYVGMLNDPIQNAAVTLAAPVLLAFNAVNNLFGVGSSSMMSRALGRKDIDTVQRSSAFGFYSALFCGLMLSLLYTVFQNPLLVILGSDAENITATRQYLLWTTSCGAAPAILNVVMAYLVRAEGASLHASLGTMSGCFLNIILDPIFILPWGLDMGAAGVIFGIFFGFSFLISPVFAVIGNRSHCNVYENGVAGITGLSLSHPNTPMQSFCISYDEIVNVTESGRTIFIYTKFCTYEILAMKNRAEAVQIIRSRMSGTV